MFEIVEIVNLSRRQINPCQTRLEAQSWFTRDEWGECAEGCLTIDNSNCCATLES